MNTKIITNKLAEKFCLHLIQDEKSTATIEKYMRDIRYFIAFNKGKSLTKEALLLYKKHLGDTYAVSSCNSMLAALNALLRFCGWHDLCIKQFRVQREVFCSEDKELTKAEYLRLLRAAKNQRNNRLSLILQTICSTGIRVSELQFITVESLHAGEAIVRCKGKSRRIFLVAELKKNLLQYVRQQRIVSGTIFLSKKGAPLSRNAIWRAMKSLCKDAGVLPDKVFPHNLRHLFARTFYGIEKDIAKLADILGHASINTTRIYIITTGTEHKQKMEAMHLVM